MDCSLCSLMSFLFSCIYNLIACALEYPFIVFLLSFFITIVLMANIQTAKLICNFGSTTNCTAIAGTDHVAGGNFDYGIFRGPHTWNCPDSNQSPINIINNCVQKFPIRELLTWNHYDDLPTSVCLENNGHTVIVRATYSGNTPTLSGADLLASYTFVELRFRWSLLNSEGSEHMLNYKKFPMEMQAMHRTGPAGECTSSYDLLLVAYFYEISAHNSYLDPIVLNLHRIRKPHTKVEIPPFPLAYLCDKFRNNFYSYGGSLTEPPCYQGAEWFIFPEALAISERQLDEFRQLLSADGCSRIVRNARPVQNMDSTRVVNLNQYQPLECPMTQQQQQAGDYEEELPVDCEDLQLDAAEESCG